MKNVLSSLALLLLTSVSPQAHAFSSASYVINIDAFSAGGGSLSSGSFRVSHLTGQPSVVGPVTSPGYMLHGGFYYIHALEELLAKRATCLVFDNAALYAGFDGDGIWRSLDSGATWTAATTQPLNGRIKGLVVKPGASSTLYAATYGGGVFKSTDSADKWSACLNTGLGSLNAVSLAIDSTGKLYAGTEAGIFTSTNCDNWSATDSALPATPGTPPVSIVIDTVTASTVYAGLDGAGIYKSINSGGTWTATNILPANARVKAVVIKPGDSTKLFAGTYGNGVYYSINSGVNWIGCTTQPENQNAVSLTIDANGKLYAGTEAGVFVSSDNCANWTAINSGLPN